MSDKNKKDSINNEELQKQLDENNTASADPTVKMSTKLKNLLKKDISDFKKREKTRGAEMISIFAAHNFYSNGFTPVELRTTLEDLGPTYVKIGQIMSSRPDMLPESYCKELEKLRQNVKPLEADVVRAVIEDETGKKIDEIYSEFEDKPIGSASIGQAHYAVLKDGTQVVTKVQRPLIAEMMEKDFVLLKKLAKLVNIVTDKNEDEQVIDLVSVIEELEKVTMEELDFRVEAENTKFFKENCIEDEEVISCPTVIDDLTTKRIFTMTFVDGCSVGHTDKLTEEGCNLEEICAAIVNNYAHQILDVGTFHADPHQGNIMVSNGKPYWIDFGMIGHITSREMDQIQSLILSILNPDAEGLTNAILSLGTPSSSTNRDKMLPDVEIFLSRFEGASGISDVDVSELFNEASDLAGKHHIKLPGSYTMLVRSIISIEGVIEQLYPALNLMEILTNKLVDRMKKNFDIKQTLLDAGKDILGIGKKAAKIPGLAADALSNLSKGRMKINMELTGLDEPLEKIGAFVKNVVLALIACILFIGSCILGSVETLEPKTPTGLPLLSVVIMVFSVALGIFSILQMSNKKK